MLLFVLLACQTEAPESLPTGVEGARVARLSHVQYQNTLVDLLHLDDPEDFTEHFVDSATPSWFDNDRDALDIGPTLWLQYQAVAEAVSAQVAADEALLDKIAPDRDRDTFLRDFGRRAFRRPLTDGELDAYAELFGEGSAIFDGGDRFANGVHAVIAAMVQSPYFLYRGLGYAGPSEGLELEGYELASKLSYSLWNTMPDDELLAAAEGGLTEEELSRQAWRMVSDVRAKTMVRDLHRQWLDIDLYENLWRTDEERYGDYLESTPYAMTLEVYAYIDRVAYGGGTVEELFSSRTTVVEDRLAATYGVPGIEGLDNASMVEVQLDPEERAGLFTLSGWLALQSDSFTEDLIHRGAFVNHAVLCRTIPSPPSPVPPLPVDDEERTLRELIDAHTGTCGAGCHDDYINPVGFAFAEYDAFGGHRLQDDVGRPLDASGSYVFSDGEASWETGVEFLEYVAVSPQAHRCYVEHLLAYTEGRRMGPLDEPRIEAYTERSLGGEPIIELLTAMVTDPDYRRRP